MDPIPNPVLPGFHPDPSVCRVGDEFFMATSTFTWLPGVPIHRSTDLRDWTLIGHALDRASQVDLDGTEVWASFGVFAPTLRHHDGRFWMITSSVSMNGGRVFFVTAEDPAGPWSDPVFIDIAGIDPDMAWDDDGNCWVHFSSDGIKRCRIDDATGAVLDTPVATWSGTGLQHPEAPHLHRIGAWWYLMIAEGGTGPGHAVSIARGPSPEGPWDGCPANPVLSHRSTGHPVQNTGHGDLVQDTDGRWWMALLGVRGKGGPASYHVLGRETFLTPVEWDDGWPVIEPPSAEEVGGEEFVDDFGGELDLGWIARRRFPEEVADLSSSPGRLTLRDDQTTLRSARPTFLGRRQRHHLCEVTTTVDVRAGEAGLAVVYDEHSHYAVGVDDADVFAVARAGPFEAELGRVARPASRVTLRLATTDGLGGPDRVELGFVDDDTGEFVSLGEIDGRFLSSEVVSGFLGRVIGVYVSKGHATFADFRYRGG